MFHLARIERGSGKGELTKLVPMEALTPASPEDLPPLGELITDDPFWSYPAGAERTGVAHLTQDGWVRAWASLVRLDPGAAEGVALELARKRAAYADKAAEAERRAKMHPFRALGVEVQTEAAEVWTIGGYVAIGGAKWCHDCLA